MTITRTLNLLDPLPENQSDTPQFLWVKDHSYEGDMLVLDNHLYERCKFVNVHFVYSGGPFGFRDCDFLGSCLSATGAARRVIEIENLFREILQQSSGPF